jgi:hypothetical protein
MTNTWPPMTWLWDEALRAKSADEPGGVQVQVWAGKRGKVRGGSEVRLRDQARL